MTDPQTAMRDAREALIECADHLAELYAKYQLKIGPFASQSQRLNVKARNTIAQLDAALAQPSEEARDAARWISVRDRIPQYQDGEDGLRVLVLTAEHDFAGEQIHDIPASDFYAYDPDSDEPGTEVTKVATHWMWRHTAIDAALQAKEQRR